MRTRWYWLLVIPFVALLWPVYLRAEPALGGRACHQCTEHPQGEATGVTHRRDPPRRGTNARRTGLRTTALTKPTTCRSGRVCCGDRSPAEHERTDRPACPAPGVNPLQTEAGSPSVRMS